MKHMFLRTAPEVRVFDPDLRFFALCDGAEETRTETSFDEAGEFSLTVPLAEASSFPMDGIAVTEEGAFLIECITKDTRAGTAAVTGRGILSYFSRRVIPHRTVYTGRAEALLLDLISRWAPAVLPGSLSTVDYGLEAEVTVDLAPGTLFSVLRSVCAAAGLGMQLRFDGGDGSFVFSVRQAVRTPVFLSHSLGNLQGVTQTRDHRLYANRAVVLPQTGDPVTVDASAAPGDGAGDVSLLREIFVDGSGILASRYDTDEAYAAALRALGMRALDSRRPTCEITPVLDGETAASIPVGRICGVRDERLGIRTEALCVRRTTRHTTAGKETAVTLRMGEFEL